MTVAAIVFASALCLVQVTEASEGDADPQYKTCVDHCQNSGCVGNQCFHNCNFTSDWNLQEDRWYRQEPLYVKWKQWDCLADCRYHCMLTREEERKRLGEKPVKYHGKWPLHRVYGIQEPLSVALSALNLAMQFHGWISFCILMYYKLPLTTQNPSYGYTGLWHIYGVFAMNCWFWCAVFHGRDVDLTQKLCCSSTVALSGCTLILAILRTFDVRKEPSRVMITAPLIGFITTHILYLNFYNLDYGWNLKVCTAMTVTKLLFWSVWAGQTQHPARWKVWVGVFGGALSLLIELIDFPPYWEMVDSSALWHASTLPLAHIWWSFVKDDAEFSSSRVDDMKKKRL